MAELNKYLRSASQFTWIGEFRSLRRGGTDFTRQVLREFRGHDEKTSPDPLSDEELEEFRQFLQSYCTS